MADHIAEQVQGTREQIATARTDLQKMQAPTPTARELRSTVSKIAGGRTGTLAKRFERRQYKTEVAAARAAGLKTLSAQEASFEESVAKGAAQYADPVILAKYAKEAKASITDKIKYLKWKMEHYEERADYYKDKDDDVKEQKYEDRAEEYEKEMES